MRLFCTYPITTRIIGYSHITFAIDRTLIMKRLFVCLAVIAVSCTDYYESRGEDVDVKGTLSHDMIVLGDRLEDPYSVTNMTKAFQTLYPTKAARLEVTDLYVRFLPASSEEFDLLENAGVELMDHPMDYEILKEGDWYHDPDIPEEETTWQYAVVSADFKFPESVKCEILDNCYISEHNVTKAEDVDWDAVEREAYRLTGNGHMLGAATRAGAVAPSGRIAIVDDLLGPDPIGVSGVKITCNSFVKQSVTYTDADGNYSFSRAYDSEMRYRIVFKNKKGFGIGFNLLLVPASVSTLGVQPPEGVSLVIDKNSDRKLFCRAVVNNAAYDYYTQCADTGQRLKTPPVNLRFWLFDSLSSSSCVLMQQGCLVDGSLIENFLGKFSPIVKMFLPDITIGIKGKETYDQIYSVAQHEIAHASHFMQVGKTFWENYINFVLTSFVTSGFVTYGTGIEADAGYCAVGEMWGYYMESRLYRDRYSDSSKMFGTGFWFSPQIFMFLDERGMNRFKLFAALTSDITDVEILKAKLLSLYPESKAMINQAFERYY